MAQTYTTEAVVLKRTPVRERDRRVVLYSRSRGKISTVARGTQSVTSKNVGHIEPGYLVDTMVAYSLSSDKLAATKAKETWQATRKNLLGVSLLSFMLEFMERVTHDHEPDVVLYDAFVDALRQLNGVFARKRELHPSVLKFFVRVFALRTLDHLGQLAPITKCPQCSKAITGPVVLKAVDRAFMHPEHAAGTHHQAIDRGAYELLLSTFFLDSRDFFTFPFKHSPVNDATRFCDAIISSALERKLQTTAFV